MKKEPPTEAPICPDCKNHVWRRDHLLSFQFDHETADEERFTVCMHCSHPWKWVLGAEKPLVRPTRAELKIVWPTLKSVAMRFAMNRLFAAMMEPAGEA